MKMNLVYLALATFLLGISPAFASDSTYSDCPEQNGNQDNGYQCDPDQNDQDNQTNQDDPNQNYPDQDKPKKYPHPHGKIRYDWGRGQNGFGYCYAFDRYGNVLYWGQPQPNINCERVRRSHFNWGRSWDGRIYCYQWTPYLAVMNDGRPVHPGYCRY